MRAVILAIGLVLGSVPACLAMPVASPPMLAITIQVHGCHHHYAHDLTGWHRHANDCQTLRGVVSRKNRIKS